MKNAIRAMMVSTLMIGGMFFLLSMSYGVLDDWVVPAKYKNMKNPYAGKKDADNVGKDLYSQHCKSCHGKEGYGDGKKSAELDTEMRDLSTGEVQSQKDGELYYKAIIGRDEMPNFEKKIASKEDRWLIINYLRKLKE